MTLWKEPPRRAEVRDETSGIDVHAAGPPSELRRLTSGPLSRCLRLPDQGHWPVVEATVYEPQGYEPRYAYPLIVWFHDVGGGEDDMLPWVQRMSRRNYIGLGLRGPLPDPTGLPQRRCWSTGDVPLSWLETDLVIALSQVREQFNVHSERICVAGYGQGGTVALRLMLRQPEWFAAAISINGHFNRRCRLERWGGYLGKPLWIGQIWKEHSGATDWALQHIRLLHAAGFDVTSQHLCITAADDIARLPRDLDRWLLSRLCGETVIV